MLELKVAHLYADVEIRTAKVDSDLASLSAKFSKMKVPPMAFEVDSQAITAQLDGIKAKLDGVRKSAAAKIPAPQLTGGDSGPDEQLFPIAKLQAAGLKYQAALEKEADKAAAAVKRAQKKIDDAAKKAADDAKQAALEPQGQFVPLAGLQASGFKYQDRREAEAAKAIAAKSKADKAAAEPQGQFIPLAGLQASGLKFGDRLQAEADKAAADIEKANAKVDAANEKAQAKAVASIQAASRARQAAMDKAISERAQEASKAAQEAAKRAEIDNALDDAVNNPTSRKQGKRTEEQNIVVGVANLEKVGLLRQAIDQETDSIRRLNAELRAGTITLDQYDDATGVAASKIRAAKKEIDTLGKVGGFDSDRTAAKSRLGLGLANMLQDTVQGGSPAFAVNNVLGMAGDTGIKSLLGDGVAALGGMKAIIGVLGGVAVAAGAAFLVIDTGLKHAKLDWSDFGTVVANLAPINAIGEAFGGLVTAAGNAATGIIDALGGAGTTDVLTGYWTSFFGMLGGGISTALGAVDEYTLGWGRATDAARAAKEQAEGAARAAHQYADAVKSMDKHESTEQKEKKKTGDLIGDVIADMGGAGGAEGLADRLAAQATKVGGDKKVKGWDRDDKGELKEVEITRREEAKRKFTTDMDLAKKGDPGAIGRLTAGMNNLGMDTGRFADATKGVDRKKDASEQIDVDSEAAWDATQKSIEEMKGYQKKTRDQEAKALDIEADRNKSLWDTQVDMAKRTQSFRLPGGADGQGGLNPAEKEAKRQNDLAVAESKLFKVPELRVATSGQDFERSFQADINKGGIDEEQRKNTAITATKVTELLEFFKDQGGTTGAAARALLGPA